MTLLYEPRHEKTCLRGFANNEDTDQPAHPCSLVNTFVIHLLDRIISRLTTSEISSFRLVSLDEQADLNLTFLGGPEDKFSRDEAHIVSELFF